MALGLELELEFDVSSHPRASMCHRGCLSPMHLHLCDIQIASGLSIIDFSALESQVCAVIKRK
jgi:hypothetical protein